MKKKFIFVLIATILILIIGFILYAFSPTEKQINKEIIKANYCSVKEDCSAKLGACPFGCNILINKNEETRIQKLITRYYVNNEGCAYDCGPIKNFGCITGKCIWNLD
ncbi:MAG: hypothetical protein WCF78_01765 [archaeon]